MARLERYKKQIDYKIACKLVQLYTSLSQRTGSTGKKEKH